MPDSPSSISLRPQPLTPRPVFRFIRWNHLATDPGTTLPPLPDSTLRERLSGDDPCKCLAAPHHLPQPSASQTLSLDEALPTIGELLGYKQVQTIERYSHLGWLSAKVVTARNAGSLEVDMDTPPDGYDAPYSKSQLLATRTLVRGRNLMMIG